MSELHKKMVKLKWIDQATEKKNDTHFFIAVNNF